MTHEVSSGRPPTTGLRADWRLADGTFVEALGLMTKEAYAAKLACTPPATAPPAPNNLKHIVAASLIGTTVEWYDNSSDRS
ncbi:hypothetical protein [Streptomyces sp. NRRL F-2305]|uniref:hypothetical protein n=1 Tax=Streptomyces sp. NRRL F-2305 TaxID=1463840 RepID=UPI0004CA8038|nr:hypothetical protein [Streptomyces sp. NRRL F-2305]